MTWFRAAEIIVRLVSPGGRKYLVAIASWLAATSALALAVMVWNGGNDESREGPRRSPELLQLRLAVASMESANDALRKELDRLILGSSRVAPGSAGRRPGEDAASIGSPQDAAPRFSPAELSEMKDRAAHLLARVAAGAKEAWPEAARTLIEIMSIGSESFPILREIYEGTDQALTRSQLLPMMVFSAHPNETLPFLVGEMTQQPDPAVRRTALETAAKLSAPGTSETFRDPFLHALSAEENPQTRVLAAWGLRFSHAPEVQEALLRTASDPNEDVRRVVLRSLVSLGVEEERIQSLLEREVSPYLREYGRCLLVTSGGS